MRLAQVCVNIRQECHFLDYYTSNCPESSAGLMRLNFSKDVLLILMSSGVLMRYAEDHHQRLMQFNDEVRTRYLNMIQVGPTSIVADCLIWEEELQAVAPFIAPNAPISQVRTAIVSTTRLISLVVDYRARQFRSDLLDGMMSYKTGQNVWIPVARTFISRFRGIARDAVTDDDVSYMVVAMAMPFGLLLDAGVDLE